MTALQIGAITGVIVAGLIVLFVLTTKRRDSQLESQTHEDEKVLVTSDGREVEATTSRAVDSESTAVVEWVAPTEEAIGVSRRQFFNRSIVAMMTVGLAGFGGAMLSFLWPNKSTGFGGKISAGNINDILPAMLEDKEPFYVPEGRFYLQPYPGDDVPKAARVPSYRSVLKGMDARIAVGDEKYGVVALYQKCVHLGCRVPWCKSSQWFECPCHGSRYNRVGEKKGGPAPRGLDHFIVEVAGSGQMTVDTGNVVLGPPIGTNTTGQEAEGAHC